MLRHSWKMIRLSLVNWYTYPYHDFDISPEGVTTFVAKNGQGKSTAFDAMIQNMTGAVGGHTGIELNAKTAYGNVSGRSISSYALGALNEASDVYLRDQSDTWIAISWQHSRTLQTQTSLIYISAVKGRTDVNITHMMIAGHEVRAQDFMGMDENGDQISMNLKEWQRKYPYIDDVKKFSNAKEYKNGFIRNLWPVGETRNGSFFRNLKMTVENRWDVRYVDRSIREAIISKPNFDIDSLKKMLMEFQESSRYLVNLQQQVEIFGNLHNAMQDYENAIEGDHNAELAIKYANVMKIKYSIEDLRREHVAKVTLLKKTEEDQQIIEGQIGHYEIEIKALEKKKDGLNEGAISGIDMKINAIREKINGLTRENLQTQENMQKIDGEIDSIRRKIEREIEFRIKDLNKEISAQEEKHKEICIKVSNTQKQINDIMAHHDRPAIAWASDMDIDGIKALEDVLKELGGKTRKDIVVMEDQISNMDAVVVSLTNDIEKMKSGIFSIESIAGYFVRAKEKLAEAGIKATFLYEHVTGFVSPEWVPVIESYMDKNRFDLIVSPDDYMEADRITKEINNRKTRRDPYIRLPDTKIANGNYRVHAGSAFEKIKIDDNMVAVKSFMKYLGHIICVQDIRESHDRGIGAALTKAFIGKDGMMQFRSKGGYIPSADNHVLDESDLVFMKGNDNESRERDIVAREKKKSDLLTQRNVKSMKKSKEERFEQDYIMPVMTFMGRNIPSEIQEIDDVVMKCRSEIDGLHVAKIEKQKEISIEEQMKKTLLEHCVSHDKVIHALEEENKVLEAKKQELLNNEDIHLIAGQIAQKEREKAILKVESQNKGKDIGAAQATIESISGKIEEQEKYLRSRSESDGIDPNAPAPEQFSDMPRTVMDIKRFIATHENSRKTLLSEKTEAYTSIVEYFITSRAYVSEPGVQCENLIGNKVDEFISDENRKHNLKGIFSIISRYEQNDLEKARAANEKYKETFAKWLVETFVSDADKFIRSFRRQIRNLNEILRNIRYHGRRYEFTYKEINEYSDLLSDIVKCSRDQNFELSNDQNTDYPHLRKIANAMISCEDITTMRNQINPANWYVFDIKIHDETPGSRVPVRFLSQSGTTDSGGEGQAPKYASYIAAAYSTCYPDATKDGGVGIIAIDEAFEGLDNPTIKSIFDMFSKSGIQAIICEPDTKKSIKTLSHICHRITKSDDHVSQGTVIKTTEHSRREYIDNCPEFRNNTAKQQQLVGI